MTIKLQIITPEKIVYQNDVDQITAPTKDGEITIMPEHVGLLTQVVPGEITVKKGENTQALAVTGGFMEVAKNSVSILADYAIRAEDIEVLKAQEAQKKAQKLMEEKVSEKDFAMGQSEMIRAITQLRVATKYKRHARKPSEI
ncbi:MAG: ATP synthase F1 subunit epsilon [Patescibacteria group bacterium]